MANVIRHKISQPTKRGLRRGDAVVGTGEENYGPTSTTGYINGIIPPEGGYSVYVLSRNDDPAIYIANSDNDLMAIARTLGGGDLTPLDAKQFLLQRPNTWLLDSIPDNTITDGLMLHLDAGNQSSFINNQPTTNYGPDNFGNWGTESSAERIATDKTYKGQPTYNCRTVVGQSWRGIEKTISGLRTAAGSSGTVTMSCMVRNNNGTAYNMYAYIGHDFGSTRSIPANSDWIKVEWTVNQSSMNNDYVEFRPHTNNASIYLEMTMPMVEVNVNSASDFVSGTRSQNTVWRDLSGYWRESVEHFTLYALTYPESSQTPASRDGITPGYNNTTNSKLYNASRDVNYYVFDEDSNSWVDDSYFNGERIDGHSYDTYDGQPNQHDQFNQDWDAIVGDFPNATHIIIASHAAERFWTNSEMLDKLKSIGLPDGIAGANRPEFILVGKINKPYTWRFHYENVSNVVAHMNLGLPLEGGETNLYNGTSFNSEGWLEFDGSNDRAYTSYDINYGNETTWVATVKRDTNNNNYNMFMGNFLPYFGFRASTNYKVHFSNDIGGQQRNVYSTTQTVTGKWYHIAFTTEYNSPNTTMRVFLDGVEEGSGTWSSSQTQRSGESKKFTIGDGRSNATWYPLDGKVSNVKIYNRKLSSSEISQNYYGGNIVTDGLTFATDAGNLVSYENGSTTVYSLTGSDSGTLVNGASFNSSNGGVFTFDGANEYIRIPAASALGTSQITVAAWVYPTQDATTGGRTRGTVFGGPGALYLGLWPNSSAGSSAIHTAVQTTSGRPSTQTGTIYTNQWSYLLATYDGANFKTYLNGEYVTQTSQTGNISAGSTYYIGTYSALTDGNHNFPGKIACATIYNRSLSEDEILQNYNAQKARFL